MIPTLRSLPDPLALRNHLAGVYDLPFTTCTLLRSLVNDVYELATTDSGQVLKLYRAGGWDPAEILWETGLSAHLTGSGLPVPRVHLLADGNEVGRLDAAEGMRPFVLSEFDRHQAASTFHRRTVLRVRPAGGPLPRGRRHLFVTQSAPPFRSPPAAG